MRVDRVAHRVVRPVLRQVEMRHLPGGMHARHRCGRLRAAKPSRRRSPAPPARSPPGPNAGRPAAASRHRASRHIRCRGGSAATLTRPGREFGAESRRVDQLAALRRFAPGDRLQRLALVVALEFSGALMRIAEAAVIGRLADDDRQLLAGLLQPDMRLADQCAADAGAVEGRLHRQRRERHGRKPPVAVIDIEPREQDMPDDMAVLLGHQFEHRIAALDQRVDQPGLRLLAERMFLDEADRLAILRRGGPDRHHAHESLVPFSIFKPRRNSSAVTGLPPARCNSVRRTAPSAQATVSRSSMTSPGAPAPSAGAERSSFSRSALPPSTISHQAPGKGDRPRIWLWTCARRTCPVDARLRLVDLPGIDRRPLRAAASKPACRPRAFPAPRPSGARPPASAGRAIRLPSRRVRSRDARSSATGPVSSPSSIFITIMPVSWSPAMIARWMGAAPRQRGSSEAWPL